jgi:broad specificity phosphatase PhoE
VRSVLLIRHATTSWNDAGRMQGRADIPLSEKGRAEVLQWQLPFDPLACACFTSPLRRARHTAYLLGIGQAIVDERLIEMSWGDYEGKTLDELRRTHGEAFARDEARGADFERPNGESPRMVATRLASFLSDAGCLPDERPVLAVTHRGVLRSALVLGTGWDMLGPSPLPLEASRSRALELEIDQTGSVKAVRLVNLSGMP